MILLLIIVAFFGIYKLIQSKKNAKEEKDIEIDDKTYSLGVMSKFIKRRLDEITKINLYDIGLSEEELKRRKNKKYELIDYPFQHIYRLILMGKIFAFHPTAFWLLMLNNRYIDYLLHSFALKILF